MRRYWLPAEALKDGFVDIEGDQLRHIRDVCRMGAGARFEVLLGDGSAYLVEIVEEWKRSSRARVLEARAIAPLPSPQIHLVLCAPRFPVFEAVLEKAVELGVASIVPALSDFSFVRTQDDALAKKRPRWEKIVASACQQSGRGELMPIAEARRLDQIASTFNRSGRAVGLFAYEAEGFGAKEVIGRLRYGRGQASEQAPEQALERAHGQADAAVASPHEIWLFVGAEGGFSDREAEMFRSLGLHPMTLGPQVLRVETACVALISVLKYEFDLMR